MKAFLLAALPWIALAIAVAVIAVRLAAKPKKQAHGDDPAKQAEADKEETYLPYGISIGMCMGVAIGSALSPKYGSQALTYGICFGMLLGTAAGSLIKKK